MDFLAKNAEQIAKYNKPLADKILSHVIESGNYRLDYTKCDDLNLYIDEMPVHDEIDPIEQAKVIFDKNYQKDHVNIIFGLGLGYLFQRFIKEVNNKILVYEPNIDVLRITLGLFDFSEALANPKIRIIHDKFNLKAGIESVNIKDDLFTVYVLPFHQYRYKPELDELVNDLTSIHGLIDVGFRELARQSRAWGYNTIYNFDKIYSNNELEALKGKFKDKPAVIVSAGPSLMKSIEALKKYRENVVVISVGIALKALLKEGIVPDFTAIIEGSVCLYQLEGLDTSKINFIFPPEVSYRIYEHDKIDRAFNYYTENLFTSDWVQEFTGVDCCQFMNRGTVSITAVWSAHLMGCNPIILTGQDLAYVDGKCYAGGAQFGLECVVNQETGEIDFIVNDPEAQRASIANYNKNDDPKFVQGVIDDFINKKRADVTKVKGQNGEWLPTSAGYSLFVKHFEELIPELEGIKLFNSSPGGAQIDGYENISMEDALAKFATEKIDVEQTILDAIGTYKKPTSIEHKMDFVNKNILLLEDYVKACEKGISYIKKFRLQHKRTRMLTTALKQLFFKALEVYYSTVKNIYTKNRYLMSMSYLKFTETEDALKKFEKSRTDEDLMDLVEKTSNFFNMAVYDGNLSVSILKSKKALINETVSAKS